MTVIKPIRSFILSLAGKVITGEDFNEHDRRAIAGFKEAFPDLQNPVHVRCNVEGHRSGGAVVFPDEVIAGGRAGNIQERNGEWVCTQCGDGKNVRQDVIRVL
jgi:hypothetical protein